MRTCLSWLDLALGPNSRPLTPEGGGGGAGAELGEHGLNIMGEEAAGVGGAESSLAGSLGSPSSQVGGTFERPCFQMWRL